ncbi:MAG: rhomboid family intramembrane serine protease [Bacteroidales bacterium]|nr:rhomboid family intramembrane serine protease [Bacteroidales bacterium]
MSEHYRPQGFRLLPPVIKNLLILNGLFFLATFALGSAYGINLIEYLGLHYFAADKFSPFQFITYMFMHGGIAHIFFNMFALWMFGNVLENVWGPRRFLIYYFVTGIGAALVHYLVFYIQINPTLELLNSIIDDPSLQKLNAFVSQHTFQINQYSGEIWAEFQEFKTAYQTLQHNPGDHGAMQEALDFMSRYKEYFLNKPNVVGASGAVFGILLAFGMMFPNTLIYLYFFIPIKAKWFVIIFGAIELYSGFTETGSNVAHFAHLGGMIFGFVLLKLWYGNVRRNRPRF